MMKKAIVLMMTLGFIAVITALVLYTLSISQKSFATVSDIDAQNQFSLTFKDFTVILKEMTKEVKTADALNMLLSIDIPPFPEPTTGMTVGFEMESYMKKLNINAILTQLQSAEGNCDQNFSTEILCRPLKRFLERYEIQDKRLMIDLMLDTIDKDDMELGGGTEIAVDDIDFAQGKIYNYHHLKKIFDRYYTLSSDKNVYQLTRDAVEEVFWFGDTNLSAQMLDCSTAAVISATQSDAAAQSEEGTVFGYILPAHMLGTTSDYCSLFDKKSAALASDPELKKIKSLFRINQFDLNNTKSKYLIKCLLILGTKRVENNLHFSYDITHKRIDRIEESVSK